MKGFDGEQFNYLIDFAIRELNFIYFKQNEYGRTPVKDLRLKIKNRIKDLEKRKLK